MDSVRCHQTMSMSAPPGAARRHSPVLRSPVRAPPGAAPPPPVRWHPLRAAHHHPLTHLCANTDYQDQPRPPRLTTRGASSRRCFALACADVFIQSSGAPLRPLRAPSTSQRSAPGAPCGSGIGNVLSIISWIKSVRTRGSIYGRAGRPCRVISQVCFWTVPDNFRSAARGMTWTALNLTRHKGAGVSCDATHCDAVRPYRREWPVRTDPWLSALLAGNAVAPARNQ